MVGLVFTPHIALLNAISQVKGGTLGNIVTATEPVMRKKGNPLADHKVVKVSKYAIQLATSYENSVNNRLKKEGTAPTFETSSLPYGEWVIPNRVLVGKDDLQLRMTLVRNGKTEVCYFVDGRLATEDEANTIITFSQKRTAPNTQLACGIQSDVKVANVKFRNILSLRADGIDYTNPMLKATFKVEFA